MDIIENLFSKAEIAYKSGRVKTAMRWANKALDVLTGDAESTTSRNNIESSVIALKIFIARCFSALGKYTESNNIYRELLREDIYFAPIVVGLFYNNFCAGNVEKMSLNLGLVKSCLLLP